MDKSRRMNSKRNNERKRKCALRGGGYNTNPAPLFETTPGGAMAPIETIVRTPENAFPEARLGAQFTPPNLQLAQTPMAGGRRSKRSKKTMKHRHRRQCGGACGCNVQNGGGGLGFSTLPTSVGGSGPNVAPIYAQNPCLSNFRAGDVPVMVGGGSGFSGPDCYKGPGSELPVVPTQSAGFSQTPSTWSLPPGVANAFMQYNPVAARVGGSRKRRSHKRSTKKHRKHRK
jgi:hypothetical protein